MQKGRLYEAILLVNRGVDEAVRVLERSRRAKNPQLDSSCFDEEPMLSKDRRVWLNSYFCGTLLRSKQRDSVRFETRHHECGKKTLDEVQVYRDVRALEDRPRVEGKPPRVRFFKLQERREWEGQYPRPADAPRTQIEAKP